MTRMIEGGIYVLLFFMPFSFGGVEGWAEGAFLIAVGALAIARLTAIRRQPSPRAHAEGTRARRASRACLALFLLVVVLQIIPLPGSVLRKVSPATHAAYSQSVPGYAEGRPFEGERLVPWLMEREGARRGSPAAVDSSSVALNPPLREPGLSWTASPWRTISLDPYATRRTLALLLCYVALFVIVTGQFRTKESRRRLIAVAGLSAASVSLFGIIQKLTWNGRLYWVVRGDFEGAFGPFVNHSSYAAFAGLILPVALCQSLKALRRYRPDAATDRLPRLLGWSLCTVLIGAGVLLSLSRGGIISAAIAVAAASGLILYFGCRPREIVALALLLAAGAGLVAYMGPGKVIERVGTIAEAGREGSVLKRFDLWLASRDMIADRPALGSGLGTFESAFQPYAPPGVEQWRRAHNEYLELLSDVGLTGAMALFGAFLGWLARVARPGRMKERSERYVYAGLVAGVLGTLVHALISSVLRVPSNGMLFAMAAALLGAIANDRGRSHHQAAPARAAGRVTLPAGLGAAAVALLMIAIAVSGARLIAASRHLARARTAAASGELSLAYDAYRSVSFWQPGDASPHLEIGRLLTHAISNRLEIETLAGAGDEHRHAIALSSLGRGISLNPTGASAWFKIANLYFGLHAARRRAAGPALEGVSEEMLAELREVIAGLADREETAGATAALQEFSGSGPSPEEEVAIAALRQALALEPAYYPYHDSLADLYRRRGMAREAALEVEASFALAPDPRDHPMFGDALLQREFDEAVLAGMRRATTTRFVEPADAALARARFLHRLGRLDEAAGAYGEIDGSRGEAPPEEVLLERARLEEKRGNPDGGRALYERIVRTAPRSFSATTALLHLGRTDARTERYDEAEVHYRKYLAARPGDLSAYRELAQMLEKAGRPEESERLHRVALRKDPENVYCMRDFARFLIRQGRRSEARPLLEEMVRRGKVSLLDRLNEGDIGSLEATPESVEALLQELEREPPPHAVE